MSGRTNSQERGGFGRRAMATAITIALWVTSGSASPNEPARGQVVIELSALGGACQVAGSFDAPVKPGVVWSVLTDYEGIGRFVSAVRASRMERQPDGRVLLRQDAVGGVFVFRKRMQVLLALEETPCTRIAFHDVAARDFAAYDGEWLVRDDSTSTHVEYHLTAEPRAAVARALCRGALRKSARDLLAQVRAEVMRRAPDDAAR